VSRPLSRARDQPKVADCPYGLALSQHGQPSVRRQARHNTLTENPPTFARVINDAKVRAVRTVAERALRDDIGLLRDLNVAHVDELSGQKLDDLTKRIVSDFHERQKEKD
jgi:hypothetical protein